MTKTSSLPRRSDRNAILLPSGDKVGEKSLAGSVVRRWSRLLGRSMLQMSMLPFGSWENTSRPRRTMGGPGDGAADDAEGDGAVADVAVGATDGDPFEEPVHADATTRTSATTALMAGPRLPVGVNRLPKMSPLRGPHPGGS